MKEFFGVLISVLVCVFVVFLGVYAATTIGLDISIDDDLIIGGNNIDFGRGASISNTGNDLLLITEDLISFVGEVSISSNLDVDGIVSISDALIIDGYVSVSAGDFSIEAGDFSVDGTASISDILVGGVAIRGGTASPEGSSSSPTCTAGDIYIRATAASDEIINVCEAENSWQAANIAP